MQDLEFSRLSGLILMNNTAVQYFCIDEKSLDFHNIQMGTCIFWCEVLPNPVMEKIARIFMSAECSCYYFVGETAANWENTFDSIAGSEFEDDDSDCAAITISLTGEIDDSAEEVAVLLESDSIYAFYTKSHEAEIYRLIEKILQLTECERGNHNEF